VVDADGWNCDPEDKQPGYVTWEEERSRRAYLRPINTPIDTRHAQLALEPVRGWVRAGGGWWRTG
jgi:hypothetical protein